MTTKKSGRKLVPPANITATKVQADLRNSLLNEQSRVSTPYVCNVLKDLRIKADLSPKQLAKKTGFSEEYLLKLEGAQDCEVRISTLIIILDALGYDLLIKPQTERFA